MQESYIQDQLFDKQNFTETPLPKGEYESCVFQNCLFADGDLSSIKFIDCEFKGCNLSMANLKNTTFP